MDSSKIPPSGSHNAIRSYLPATASNTNRNTFSGATAHRQDSIQRSNRYQQGPERPIRNANSLRGASVVQGQRQMDSETAASLISNNGGLIKSLAGSIIMDGYFPSIREVSNDHSIGHIIPKGTILGAAKKVLVKLENHPDPSSVSRLANLARQYRGIHLSDTIKTIHDATTLEQLRAARDSISTIDSGGMLSFARNEGPNGKRTYHTVKRGDVFRGLASQAEVNTRLWISRRKPQEGTLQQHKNALYRLVADCALYYLYDGLQNCMANFFVQRHPTFSDELMGVGIKACMEVRQRALDAIEGDRDSLMNIVDTYVRELRGQQISVIENLQRIRGDDEETAIQMLTGGRQAHAAELYSIVDLLDSENPPDVAAVKARLIRTILEYEDSFNFDYAKSPHHELNKDLNIALAPAYVKLQTLGSSREGSNITLFAESVQTILAQERKLFANFGVENIRRQRPWAKDSPLLPLMRHILMGAPLPRGCTPYKCTARQNFLTLLTTASGHRFQLPTRGFAAVHQDISAAEYPNLLKSLRTAFSSKHATAQSVAASNAGSRAFDFTCNGKSYRFVYRTGTGPRTGNRGGNSGQARITEAEVRAYSPNRINQKVVVKLMPGD